ncbi:MAG: SDR family oxidoreductase [Chloroflexota bacterium]
MRLLILGGSGMIGHRVWLAARERAEAWATVRGVAADLRWADPFDQRRLIAGVSTEDLESFDRALDASRPDVVINAIGLIKSGPEPWDDGAAFRANCLVPHYVRARCDASGARLIHISSDCVFSGTRGGYSEDDVPDALDSYGLSKRLGEVPAPHLTIRTSAIGRSLDRSSGLVEWLLSQQGAINGWRRARFSGLTTPELADTLVTVATEHPALAGTWHVAGSTIDKFALLMRLRAAYDLPLEIVPVDEPKSDRSLDDRRFREATGIPKPDWEAMIERLVGEGT